MPGHKIYPIQRSPLYRLRNKRKLAELLGVSTRDLRKLVDDSSYNVFPRKQPGKKDRMIEHPTGLRELVHKGLQNLFSRIELPTYVFSGKKGVSSLDNAKHHLEGRYFVAVDIERFYPSSHAEYIFRFFHQQLLMSEDIAHLLTRIVTYNDHIPTGSSLSQSLAYWTYSRLFERISTLAEARGMTFSLYVDDMTISSPRPIPDGTHRVIDHLLRRVALHLKGKKTRYRSGRQYKVVTGGAISPDAKMRVPNRLRRKIITKLRALTDIEHAGEKPLQSLYGSILSARQIEPEFLDTTFRRVGAALERVSRGADRPMHLIERSI
jgi:RNA-directed DNA polymerase